MRVFLGRPSAIVQILHVNEVDVTIFVPVILAASDEAAQDLFSEEGGAYSQVVLRVLDQIPIAKLSSLHLGDPGVVEHLWDADALGGVQNQHLAH
mmetsp:Transcript_10825/g.14571  ORF Transcript_10825/g.14571 Transcript_10825/m.14571 type:complete len:95 (-) Transcript_10825:1801-2085(-)